MTLIDELKIRLSEGLKRKASTTCSQWTENYVIYGKPVPGPHKFDRHPWTKWMHDLDMSWNGMKAAQMGFTQVALNRCLFVIDIKRISILYILPKKTPDAADFSKDKFDTMLDMSPHIANMFSNTRNIGHKQSGAVSLFLRGARSRSGLKTISTGVKVFDEFDEMVTKSVALAAERSSGFETKDKQDIKISTPTIPGFGISKVMDEESCEHHYIFKCPSCGKLTELLYPECLVITTDSVQDAKNLKRSHIICKECKNVLPHQAKPDFLHHSRANWVPMRNLDCTTPGFWIPQLYSTVMEPWEIAKAVLQARDDPSYEQELWNSKMGLPFQPKGAAVSDDDIVRCYGGYSLREPAPPGRLITMGVDVGHKELYCEISEWLLPPQYGTPINEYATSRIIGQRVIQEFPQLDLLMQEFRPVYTVIDVDPYMRDALSYALRYPGHVSMCRFVNGIEKNQIIPQESDQTVFVNRTSWLDISQNRFRRSFGCLLPNDTLPVYKEHIKNLVRIIKEDKVGELRPRYVSRGPDHFGLAHCYNDIALPMAVSVRTHQDIKSLV